MSGRREGSQSPACIGNLPQNAKQFHIFRRDFLIDMSDCFVFEGFISEEQFLFPLPISECEAIMRNSPQPFERTRRWSPEALALVDQAKVLSGNKLEQLVVRLQRHSGRSSEECWRFVIRYGIKAGIDYRRWMDEEIDIVREELVKRSVEEVAKKLGRTAKSVRSMLQRNRLRVRDIRCDVFSVESLSRALHVRKAEIRLWIERGWLEATVHTKGRRTSYTITAEALAHLYKRHLPDLLRCGLRNQSLFEAYVQYVHSPKHTVGEQLLDVRRDKRERAAFAAVQANGTPDDEEEGEEDGDDTEQEYGYGNGRIVEFEEGAGACS
jgi:hypothetical protein